MLIANYNAVAKENSQLARQLEEQRKEIDALLVDKARLVSEKKKMSETLVGGQYAGIMHSSTVSMLSCDMLGAGSVGGGADQSSIAQLQRELEAVRHEAESVRVERDELKEQNDEVMFDCSLMVSIISCFLCVQYVDNIAFLQDRLKQGEADKRLYEARIKNLDLNVRDLNGQVCNHVSCDLIMYHVIIPCDVIMYHVIISFYS